MIKPSEIDIDIVEAIIKENNGQEYKWLKDLLESGIKIRGVSGRFLKPDRFLRRLINGL